MFGEAIEIDDSDDISPAMRGYVQQALASGIMQVSVSVSQGRFDLEPTVAASFVPDNAVTRADVAFSLTLKDQL